jgi:hypothetical protein
MDLCSMLLLIFMKFDRNGFWRLLFTYGRHTIHLQFDIGPNALEIRILQSAK